MSWGHCFDCRRMIPDDAVTCPHCGRRVAEKREPADRRGGPDRRRTAGDYGGPDRRRRQRRGPHNRRKFSY